MPQVINSNISSLNSQRNLEESSKGLSVSLQRLSSGLRINSAKDDAAGLSIATRFTSSIEGLTQASRNANDAISLAQVAEGALQETTRLLQRARVLSVQSANGTNSASDRKALQAEVNQLKQELTRIASTTSFNSLKILNGDLTRTDFQIGAEANQTVTVSIDDTRTTAIGSNEVKTNNTAGIERSTYNGFIGGGTANTAVGVGNDVGVIVNAAATNNGYSSGAVANFTVTNTTSTGATQTDSTDNNTAIVANDTALEFATKLSNLTGVSATGYNQITLSNYSAGDAADTLTLKINNGTTSSTVDILTSGGGQTYSDMATRINSDSTFQARGVYATSTSSSLTIYATKGDDFGIAGGAATNADFTFDLKSDLRTDATAGTFGSYTGLAATAGIDSGTNELTIGGRVDITLDAEYTLAPSNAEAVNFIGGTAGTDLVSTASGLSGVTAGNNVEAQTLTVSGSSGSSDITVAANDEASALATKINAVSGTTNVTATALTTVNLSSLSADGTVSFNLYGDNLNSSPAAISAAVTTTDLTALVKAINEKAGTTGITAATDSSNGDIVLTHASGKNIQIENFSHSSAVDYQDPTVSAVSGDGSTVVAPVEASIVVTGNKTENGSTTTTTLYDGGIKSAFDSTVVGGQVTLSSSSSFSASSSVNGVGYAGGLLNSAANASNTSVSSTVNEVDISTVAGAQSAINVLDQALSQISSIRGDLGAIQSRFESTIRNLSNNVENLSAARSRILDTDFAAETATLTKQQILTQAGISILQQANAQPQNVLALLQ